MKLDTAAFLRRLASPFPPEGAGTVGLAAAWPVSHWRLQRALADAGVAVDEDQAGRVRELIDETIATWSLSDLFRLSSTPALSAAIRRSESLERPPGAGLWLAPELPPLPLLPLATDVARLEPGRTLRVDVLTAPESDRLGGVFLRRQEGSLVLLDIDRPLEAVERTWCHELGHALDPRWSLLGHGRSCEIFADAMADLLPVHEPETIEATTDLVLEALEACRESGPFEPYASTPALEDLLQDVLAQAGVLERAGRTSTPTLIAAHLRPAPGVNGHPAGPIVPASGPQGGSGSSEAHLRRSEEAEGSGITASEPSAPDAAGIAERGELDG